jgi:hypothetical protein
MGMENDNKRENQKGTMQQNSERERKREILITYTSYTIPTAWILTHSVH